MFLLIGGRRLNIWVVEMLAIYVAVPEKREERYGVVGGQKFHGDLL